MHISRQCTVFIICCALLFLCACGQRHHTVTRGFYYWKTVYGPTSTEQEVLRRLDVQRMYVRLFDVDWDVHAAEPIPVAPVRLPSRLDTATDFVPVIFITQLTMSHLRPAAIAALATKISGFAGAICASADMHPAEVQIDCDWTAGTKDIYFALLRELRRQPFFRGRLLSCTIRMHQVRYFGSSGIPPADKGMLMCYSMGDIKKPGSRNSILDVKVAQQYMAVMNKYPLPLDIALPLFHWCALFRDQQFRGLLHDVSPAQVAGSSVFIHKTGNLYTCLRDTVWHGYPIAANDVIRTESVSAAELEEIARFTAKRLTKQDLNVVFFSCDSITLAKYSTHELETVYNTYR